MIHAVKITNNVENIDTKLILKPETTMRIDTDRDNIKQLAESIYTVGLINPICLKKAGKYYEVVAGFRRFLAVSQLGWKVVPSIVIPDDQELSIAVMTAENYERSEVNTFDEAVYFKELMEKTGINQGQLAKVINKAQSYVSERISILTYIEQLRDALYQGKISFSVARELNRIKSDADKALYVGYAIENGCTPEIARKWRKQLDARDEQFANDINEKAAEHYIEQTNKTIVSMECGCCRHHHDVNELTTIYICPECRNVIRNTSLS